MILGARLLLLVVILDCFLYFGMSAISSPLTPSFGNQIGTFVDVNGTVDDAGVDGAVNYSSGGTMVVASTLGYTTFGIDSIIGLVGNIWGVMTSPMNFFNTICPITSPGDGCTFIQVLFGGAYIVLVLASVAQLLTGRFA